MHASEKKGNFPTFYDLSKPGFFPGSNIIVTVVTGDEALRIEKQSDAETMADVMKTLRKMYLGREIPQATGKLKCNTYHKVKTVMSYENRASVLYIQTTEAFIVVCSVVFLPLEYCGFELERSMYESLIGF